MTTHSVPITRFSVEKVSVLRDFLSLTKPRLSSLVIFTSALGMFLAPGEISFLYASVAIMATSGLVGGACAINCFMEREIDALMDRTKTRPLPAGRITPTASLIFGLSLIFTSLLTLFFVINPLTSFLGFVAAVVYIFLYTPLKTKTSLALYAGAIPGAIPPLMGWTSVTGSIGVLGLVLFAILFIWQLPHFLSIAIYHEKDYNRADIKTYPGSIGIGRSIKWICIYTYALFIISLLPFYMGAASETYKYFIMAIGGAYFLFALLGLDLEGNKTDLHKWSRGYFYGSLVYLPCVFILMIIYRLNG